MSKQWQEAEQDSNIYADFNKLIDEFLEGRVAYDEVEEELVQLRDDEYVSIHAYRQCERAWHDVYERDVEDARVNREKHV